MSKNLLNIAAGAACLLAASGTATAMPDGGHTNPFTAPYATPYEIPPFDSITVADYLPALQEGISRHDKEIEAIVNNPEEPTFANTVLAFEKSGDLINRVMLVFGSLDECMSSPEMSAIAEQIYPLYSQHSDQVMMNDKLFARFKSLYDRRDKLALKPYERRAVEEYYKSFTRNGALLGTADKAELSRLNTELTLLYQKFNKNLLNATNAWQLVVDDKAKLAGLPASSIDQAADEAKARGMEGKWVFTLQAPSRLPLLQYADNRDLRREMYQAYTSLASSGEYNNYPVINNILKTRAAKARLLGYPDYASYMTANVMAKTPKAAEELLMKIWQPAVNRVKEEVVEMQTVVDNEGGNFKIEPWDYYYYAEKVRRKKYDLDENRVRRYFAVDSVRKGIFTMANKLYGVTFTEMPDAPKYHPEVKVYDVKDADGKHLAVFMTDYFPRDSKRQGAWMSEFKGSFVDPDSTVGRPIVYNVGNFSRPTADAPALLTLDEVETMFHEFGHGLHGMLSRAALRSQSGTNVDRDFVELPSQIHEHWALEPELLKEYARDYETGEVIPDELIAKLQASSTHNQGFTTTELVGAALLDLQWGHVNPDGDIDIEGFEKEVAGKLGMPREVQFRYRSPYFKHIFGSDGYASGYYTYLWAEVLDSDGFEKFAEDGIFNPETAKAFRENVLEAGGSDDPMKLYINFRGQEPNVDALLRNRGLLPAKEQQHKPAINLKEKGGK